MNTPINKRTNDSTSTSTTQSNYSKGVEQFFQSIYQEYAADFPSVTTFLERHVFFVTVTYKRGSVAATRYIRTADRVRGGRIKSDVVPAVMDEFGKLYFDISRSLLGNSLDRKRRYQPLTFAYVDFIGSKAKGKIDIATAQGPHIHAVMLVRPQQLEKFLKLRDELTEAEQGGRSVWIEPYSASHSRLQRLVTYIDKGHRKTRTSWITFRGKRRQSENVNHDLLMKVFPA